MAHICRSQQAYFDLAATACIDRSKEAATYALFLDPLTQAILSPREIRSMTNEMFDAEKKVPARLLTTTCLAAAAEQKCRRFSFENRRQGESEVNKSSRRF